MTATKSREKDPASRSNMAATCCWSDSSSSSEDYECMLTAICAAAIVLGHKQKVKKRRKRSLWVRDQLLHRASLGAYTQLLQEFSHEYPRERKLFLRMSHESFIELEQKVRSRIQKQDTTMRRAIASCERLAITLRFLGSGDSFVSLSHVFRVADNTIRKIVLETCEAIYDELKTEYLKAPTTPREWEEISQQFERQWQFPNCIGAVDGRNLQVLTPVGSSDHVSQQNDRNIILMALVAADYRVIWFSAGCHGRAGDSGAFRNSTLAQGLELRTLGVPAPRPLPGRDDPVPYFIVGDDSFGLKPYLMKPFPARSPAATSDESNEAERRKRRIFNYRLSRIWHLSENVFGMLTVRFGVFRSPMRLRPEHATTVTLACLALHNFLLASKDSEFAAHSVVDREHPHTHETVDGEWRLNSQTCFQRLTRQYGNRSADEARWVRDEIKEYVNTEGCVSWQEDLALGRDLSEN